MTAYLRICRDLLANLRYYWFLVAIMMMLTLLSFCVQIVGSVYFIGLLGGEGGSLDLAKFGLDKAMTLMSQAAPWAMLAALIFARMTAEFFFRATALRLRRTYEIDLGQRLIKIYSNNPTDKMRATLRQALAEDGASPLSGGTKQTSIAGALLAESIARLPFLLAAIGFLIVLYPREISWSALPLVAAIAIGLALFGWLSRLSERFVQTGVPAARERRKILETLLSETPAELNTEMMDFGKGATGAYFRLYYARLNRSNVLRFIISVLIIAAITPALFSLWLRVQEGTAAWPELIPAIAVLQLIISYLSAFTTAFAALSRNFFGISRLFDVIHKRERKGAVKAVHIMPDDIDFDNE